MVKLRELVDTEEAMEKFIADYRISPNVSLRHCKMGEWHLLKRTGKVVIPILAFIKGGYENPHEADPNTFHRHFHLVNRVDLETVLQAAVFAAEDEVNLGLSDEGFGAFDQTDPSEDPSGDLGDPDLSETELLSVEISSRAEMGLKRKPPTSLFDLIEGQSGKGAQGKPQSNAPFPPPQPQPVQTRSSSTKSQPQSPRPKLLTPQSALPPRPEPADSKRKRSPKGKEPMVGGKSQSSQERDEAQRAQKQLKIGHQSKGKGIETQSAQRKGKGIEAQSASSAWLPAPMLHEESLLENASMRDLGDGDGGYVADALGRTMPLPTDMEELKNMRMQGFSLARRGTWAIQATYRMEEEVKGQSKAAEVERTKRIDAARTLKASETDLTKQVEEQTKRLLAADDQLQIAKEQISDLKKQLIEENNAKGLAEFAKDEAVRAKQQAEFARTEAEVARDKAEEEGYEVGVTETQASLKAQILSVCRLYCSQVWEEALK
ncbi:dynactin, 150 kDa isoform-like [Quercus robur]|uniref:dynactin, 150 kDa isoform-like n=1 Tax=Quercus robur TaxID=38942 RepID=UPI0021623582|nr:dynactin, 150 kDa isoform-like [Quercus robur]